MSLEAELLIKLDEKLSKISKNIDFAELCITSKSTIEVHDKDGIEVQTKKAIGNKCPVCWKISKEPCARHT